MVNWDQWQTLLAVFRGGTYAKAAAALQLNATTVGRRLKLLERKLGGPLFLRHEGRLYPTRRCAELITHVETASEVLRAAEQDSTTSDSGGVWRELRMTAPPFLITHLFAPGIGALTRAHRIRVELMGTGSHISLSKREADIAIRIEDRPATYRSQAASGTPTAFGSDDSQIAAERIGVLAYAVYCHRDLDPAGLSWAGLMEDHARTTGDEVMTELASDEGFQFRAYHFDALGEIAAAGAAKAMLPCFITDNDPRLKRASDVVLEQPLWMLHHCQDHDVRHIKGARSWIMTLASEGLGGGD